jgi:hypothetical protein
LQITFENFGFCGAHPREFGEKWEMYRKNQKNSLHNTRYFIFYALSAPLSQLHWNLLRLRALFNCLYLFFLSPLFTLACTWAKKKILFTLLQFFHFIVQKMSNVHWNDNFLTFSLILTRNSNQNYLFDGNAIKMTFLKNYY